MVRNHEGHPFLTSYISNGAQFFKLARNYQKEQMYKKISKISQDNILRAIIELLN